MDNVIRVEDMIQTEGDGWFFGRKDRDSLYDFKLVDLEICDRWDSLSLQADRSPELAEMPDVILGGNPAITYNGKNCTLFSKTYTRKSREFDLSRSSDREEISNLGFREAFVSMMRVVKTDILTEIIENNVNYQEDYLNTSIGLFTFPVGRVIGENVKASDLFSYNNLYMTITQIEKLWDIEFRLDMKMVAIIW